MINYKYNNGRGAVLCRKCRVIIDEGISYEDAKVKWDGRDLCEDCEVLKYYRSADGRSWAIPKGIYDKRVAEIEDEIREESTAIVTKGEL